MIGLSDSEVQMVHIRTKYKNKSFFFSCKPQRKIIIYLFVYINIQKINDIACGKYDSLIVFKSM